MRAQKAVDSGTQTGQGGARIEYYNGRAKQFNVTLLMVKSAALALVMAGAAASASAVPPPLTFTFDTTALKVWFNHTDSCGDSDAPDQSLAAFRRADGLVMGYSGDNSPGGFFASYGASLFGLKRNCTLPVITGSTCHACNLDPAVFPHDVWLMATWSADGGDVVHALVHDEFHANITDNVTCPSGSHTDCWYTTILAATSTDGGRTFEYARTPSNPRAIALSGPTGYRPAKVGSLNARYVSVRCSGFVCSGRCSGRCSGYVLAVFWLCSGFTCSGRYPSHLPRLTGRRGHTAGDSQHYPHAIIHATDFIFRKCWC